MEKQERMKKIGFRKLREMLPWAKYVAPLGEEDFYLVALDKDALVKCVVPKVLPVGVNGEPFIPGYFQSLYDYHLQMMLKDNRLQVVMATGDYYWRNREDGEKELRFVFRSPVCSTRQLLVGSYPKEGAAASVIILESFVSAAMIEQRKMPDPRCESHELLVTIRASNWSVEEEEDMQYDLWVRSGRDEGCCIAGAQNKKSGQINFCTAMIEFVRRQEKHDGYVASLSPVRLAETADTAIAVEVFGVTRWYPFCQEGYRQLVQTIAMAKHLASELQKKMASAPVVSFESDDKSVSLASLFRK